MQFYIITPFKKITKDVDWVEIETQVGNRIVQDEHAPMILSLKPESEIIVALFDGKQESIKIKHAVAHIERDSITILGDL